jgi:hypothetical protein
MNYQDMDGLNIMMAGLIGVCLSSIITALLLFLVDLDDRSFLVRVVVQVGVINIIITLVGIVLHLTGIL